MKENGGEQDNLLDKGSCHGTRVEALPEAVGFMRGRSGSRSKSRSPEKRSKREDRASSRNRERDRGRRERSRSRERRRSRSRDRKRPRRSRSRERRRSRSRERRRSRSRHRSRSASPSKSRKNDDRSKSKERSDNNEQTTEKKKIKEEKEEEKVEDQDFDQNKLEEEMRKRKERVEKWREEQRRKAMENIGELKKELEEMKQGKKWSLEDDDDDDEEALAPAEAEEEEEEAAAAPEEAAPMEEETGEELDPLDAYMEEVKEEVKKFNMGSMRGGNDKKGGMKVTKVMTVLTTKKAPHTTKKKGELMENDQDAMEYSSEEEEVDLQTALTGYQTKQRKVLEPVDHQKIEYDPYRKNFYVEVPELAKMTPEEVNVYRLELEGIMVKGKGCPKPIKTWVQCGTSMKILCALKKHGYEKPTPIQTQARPRP
ncbi:hypothetical protein ANANG_G00149140 [Anguilla anguilla]|uniref:RNA helicase n=1 Tax=Anguilla anguilla TaxID=7936 RepID=A0A9D3RXW7_ANGAN|nr:hypothetical protein ANANG_G00149140 [Anguilla anguilla]